VHLLGRGGKLYGKTMHVFFERYLRPEASFPSAEALARRIEEDMVKARAYFRRNP
jgi:FAD synthase